ncbi:MAG: hypothetical protein LBB80_03535 [Treponema sp.]|jgi:uncharacterized membrane-anchored protein|nr:hypothetical protein [Treponema sp.]
MADTNVVVDDSLPFDLTKSLEENLVMMKTRFIKDGMSEKEVSDLMKDICSKVEQRMKS